jgi:hypothetical protein
LVGCTGFGRQSGVAVMLRLRIRLGRLMEGANEPSEKCF